MKQHDRTHNICKTLATVVFKEHNGKENPHYVNLLAAFKKTGMSDIGEQIVEDIGAIVTIGLVAKDGLTEDMLDNLEEKVKILLRILTKHG